MLIIPRLQILRFAHGGLPDKLDSYDFCDYGNLFLPREAYKVLVYFGQCVI
jgi:hypothetical protein